MLVASGRRAGRSHRDRDLPCQDAYAVQASDDGRRVAAAVADGLGSRSLSHLGSQAACEAAARSLAASTRWGPVAMHRAFRAARAAVAARAKALGVPTDELATTLQVAGFAPGQAIAGIVGDGAVLYEADGPRLLLAPEDAEYANHVVPLTSADWQDHLRIAAAPDANRVFLFTDGLTRLLLTRKQRTWQPYAPFFDSFLPKLRATQFDPAIVARFLETDNIDRAWDDDKCMVVMGLD